MSTKLQELQAKGWKFGVPFFAAAFDESCADHPKYPGIEIIGRGKTYEEAQARCIEAVEIFERGIANANA